MDAIDTLDLLDGTDEADALAAMMIAQYVILATEPRDPFHIAIAATKGVKLSTDMGIQAYCPRLLRRKIEFVRRDSGFEPSIICTPEEHLGNANDTESNR